MQLFVKDLTVIDASYLCPQRGMVGHSWIVDVLLIGDLDSQSMVLDFGLVKKKIKQVIDQEVDHKLLVPKENLGVTLAMPEEGMISLTMATALGAIHLYCPEQGLALLPTDAIDRYSITAYLIAAIQKTLPVNIEQLKLTLREEVIATPSYHYSHGLKKHDGNCQRIAHGHRSMIEIWQDGARNHDLEAGWAKRWQDIYLGSTEDQVTIAELSHAHNSPAITEQDHYGFSYRAQQGLFELAIPKTQVELIDSDTTVECLASYIVSCLKNEQPLSSPLKVIAYEGVGKGAIASDD